ncbi:MAG: PQQ-dependent dehydrogenase, methanol/ethanol family [Acidobacteria bacterium]|nr:PQQ-dependent dehydrogenase, methanol/ethanol family [Acidobacteriota bacterium]
MKALAILLVAAALSAQVKYEDILKGPGANWITYAGGYSGQRHSSLTQISTANAGSIVPKWVYHVPKASGLRTHPLVYNGVMYITNTNRVIALDARTGRQIWEYFDPKAKKDGVNRGAAVLGDKVFFVTSDVHLVALDRRNGALLWQTKYGDPDKGQNATLAPLVVKDKVLVGNAGGDTGMRGSLVAINANTGKEDWRLYTIPAKGEPGSETWSDLHEWGGGATWLTGTYDPALNLIYWPTGNPWPDFYGGNRKGDNLYSASVLAIDADTGKMKWYFQFTPHDVHDWDAQAWPVLVDLPFRGQQRKLMLYGNRNGFYYVLDRVTGEYLHGTKLVDRVDWASGLDDRGRPVLVAGKDPTITGNVSCPGVRGATNWMSPSFNPATGLFYIMTLEQCDVYSASTKEPEPMKGFSGGGAGRNPESPGRFVLRALEPTTGKRRWEYAMSGKVDAWPGTLSTAGGVIFSADDDGHLVAFDARNGKVLWHFQTGETINTSPVTFAVDGKQYVSIASSTAIFTFGLFEPAAPVTPPVVKEVP